jgi:hypothetical protein
MRLVQQVQYSDVESFLVVHTHTFFHAQLTFSSTGNLCCSPSYTDALWGSLSHARTGVGEFAILIVGEGRKIGLGGSELVAPENLVSG